MMNRTLIAGFVAALGMSSGCGDATGPSAPSSPNIPAVSPVNAPIVSAVFPSKGSTGGGTAVMITGTGFRAGATVTLGAMQQTANVENSTTIRVMTPAQDAGMVEVAVTNPDGQSARLTGAYSYAPPESFDFNGAWQGAALAHPDFRSAPQHSDMELRFTIVGNRLTTIECGGTSMPVLFPPSVSEGAFSHASDDDVAIAGRIVADGRAVGTINTSACPATRWAAEKR